LGIGRVSGIDPKPASDRKRTRGETECLQRIFLRDVGRQLRSNSSTVESSLSLPGAVGTPKAGHQVPALLGESERRVERDDAGNPVFACFAWDEEAGVFETRQGRGR